jgi:hypothetical protein
MMRRLRDALDATKDLTPAMQTYVWATSAAMALYVVTLLYWGMSLLDLPVPATLHKVFVVAAALAIVFHMWALLRAMQSFDEFLRAVNGKRVLTAAMITIGGATIWGLLQIVGWAPAFPLPFIYIALFLVNVALIPFINADRP